MISYLHSISALFVKTKACACKSMTLIRHMFKIKIVIIFALFIRVFGKSLRHFEQVL